MQEVGKSVIISKLDTVLQQITFENFNRVRKSFALAFLLFGNTVVYFFRDGLKLAPGSTAFTAFFLFLSLFLMLPVSLPKTLYTPNKLLNFFSWAFLLVAFSYMLTYAPNRGWFTKTDKEIIYYSLIFFSFLILNTISLKELNDNFLKIVIVLSIIGCLGLVYNVARNPLYVLGSRASIKLGSGEESTDNPHIFAKNALFGLFALIALVRTKQPLSKLFLYGSTLFFVMILFLTQSMSTILTLGVALGITFVLTFSAHQVVGFINFLFSPRFIKYYVLAILPIAYILLFTKFLSRFQIFFDVVWLRFGRIFNTITGSADTKDFRTVDYSSSGRIETLNEFFEKVVTNWEEKNILKLIFGNGYQDFFFDNPMLETYNDLGILGFFLFAGWHVYALYISIREIRNPTNNLVLFISYSVIYVFLYNLTGGMPYDYLRWTMMAFVTRFLIRRITIKKVAMPTLSTN